MDFAARLEQCLALLGGHQHRKVFGRLDRQFVPAPENACAFFDRGSPPFPECAVGGLDGAPRVGCVGRPDFRDRRARRGIVHGQDFARLAGLPGAVHVGRCSQQALVF